MYKCREGRNIDPRLDVTEGKTGQKLMILARKVVEMMDHGMFMLSKKEKAGKGEKTGRKKKVWNHSLALRIKKTQSRTNYGGTGRTRRLSVVKESNV